MPVKTSCIAYRRRQKNWQPCLPPSPARWLGTLKRSTLLVLGVFSLQGGLAAAPLAEIVSLSGKGDYRRSADEPWSAARVQQALENGHTVRTLDASSMSLLFVDQTQIKLGADALFQLRQQDRAGAAQLELKRGRSWSQTKSAALRERSTGAPGEVLTVTTPAGVAAIRGTEWAIEVADNGLTTVTVLEGRVEFGNDHGQVTINPNEEAVTQPGSAPSKFSLIRARDRVQWVANYRFPWSRYPELVPPELVPPKAEPASRQAAPAQWRAFSSLLAAGDLAGARAELARHPGQPLTPLLQAELALAGGQPAAVDQILADITPHPADISHRRTILRAEARLRRDDLPGALALLATAPEGPERELLLGEVARLSGSVAPARAAFDQVRALAPQDARGWLGSGKVAAERDDLGRARELLDAALQRATASERAPILAERAHADSLGNRLNEARAGYAAALALAPDDFVALTGLGLTELKDGAPEAALIPLLKAVAIEPGYARAVLYTGIAYFQLGRPQVALDTFSRAAELDPNDPLPHFYKAMLLNDRLEPGAAIEAARAALVRWPKLKSLSQVASDQKGSANLGAALARFGLPEWALSTAWQAYTPFWGGSALFLADRLPDTWSKNSLLFQGFLADPLVFGVSPHQTRLLPAPEATLGIKGQAGLGPQYFSGANITANGYRVTPVPLAGFIDLQTRRDRPDDLAIKSELDNLTLGLGIKPDSDNGFFLFANRYRFGLDFTDPGNALRRTPALVEPTRVDLGWHHRFDPEAQLWLKVGSGRQTRTVAGPYATPASLQNWAGYAGRPPSDVRLDYRDLNEETDLQLKLAWVNGHHQRSLTLEYAEGDSNYFTGINTFGQTLLNSNSPVLFAGQVRQQRQSTRLGYSDWLALTPRLDLHGQLAYTAYRQDDVQASWSETTAGIRRAPETSRDLQLTRFSPRLGMVWRFAETQAKDSNAPAALSTGRLRLAVHDWLQPAGVSSLDRLDTAGLPLDTRSLQAGGRSRGGRAQLEWETPQHFLQTWLATERIDNRSEGFATGIAATLSELEKLRQKAPEASLGIDLLEGTPHFAAGRVDTLGFAGNWILTPQHASTLRLILRDSDNRRPLPGQAPGQSLPYMPRETFALGSTHFLTQNWVVGGQAVWRSLSYADAAHQQALPAGWGVDLFASWRSSDRRWRFTLTTKGLGREQPAPRSTMAQLEAWW